MQKAATPVPGRTEVEGVPRMMDAQRPNAVVLEKSGNDESDINAQRIAAVQNFSMRLDQQCMETESEVSEAESADADEEGAREAKRQKNCMRGPKKQLGRGSATRVLKESHKRRKVERCVVSTGSAMIDQFQPWYFGVAFAFLFKDCTGMPDVPAYSERVRHRRVDGAPRVEVPLWVRIMSRRIEAQLNRDWHFGCVAWNYLFRSTVNLSRTIFSYEQEKDEEGQLRLTSEELEKGAVEICKALWKTYTDVGGKSKSVAGDMTKIRYVPGLSNAATKLLQNIEHTSRKIPGTQEIRRQMRFDTDACRVRYGVPIFVTFSPDESHNLLMIRFAWTRAGDPVLLREDATREAQFGRREEPDLTNECSEFFAEVSVEELVENLPAYDERQLILARDSLASVDGFRALVLFAYEYLFGMRVCPLCPDCNNHGAFG